MSNRVVIVTGAARGIGLAATKLFLVEGATVVMVDNDNDELIKASTDLQNVLPICCDVADPELVDSMVAQTLENYARIDCLVNNAGVADFGPN